LQCVSVLHPKVYGIDPGKTGIERAQLKIKYSKVQNVELIEGAAETMPFEKQFFSSDWFQIMV